MWEIRDRMAAPSPFLWLWRLAIIRACGAMAVLHFDYSVKIVLFRAGWGMSQSEGLGSESRLAGVFLHIPVMEAMFVIVSSGG